MKINDQQFKRMPAHLQVLFRKLPNPGSEEVLAAFPVTSASKAGGKSGSNANPMSWTEANPNRDRGGHDDNGGSAARFFYCPKASKRDRDEGLDGFERQVINVTEGHGRGAVNTSKGGDGIRENRPRANIHPTVKPTELMAYLCRLVTPPGGVVLDPFMGSGSTGKAAMRECFRFIGIEREPKYFDIACRRIEDACRQPRLIMDEQPIQEQGAMFGGNE